MNCSHAKSQSAPVPTNQLLTTTAEMMPFPHEDTPPSPLNSCTARCCNQVLFIPDVCNCQWLCPSSPGHCQHLRLKYLHIFQSKQVSNYLSSLCLLYHFWHRSTKASVNYLSAVSLLLCREHLFSAAGISEQGAPNLLPTVPSTFSPSHNCTGMAFLVSIFLSYFYQLPFSYINPITSFVQSF